MYLKKAKRYNLLLKCYMKHAIIRNVGNNECPKMKMLCAEYIENNLTK